MDEFELIRQYFTPLSHGFAGGLGLNDDAAILPSLPGCDLVVTKDALSEGVHFIGDEAPYQLAQKALRVNLSDLAAMGAQPLAYFLAIMLPPHSDHGWVADFARGLNDDQSQFGIYLAGGDTIATKGPLSFSITAIGSVPEGSALKRSTAEPGDAIYCSGTLGDSALGLGLLQRSITGNISDAMQQFLHNRYHMPQPRLLLGQRLRDIALPAKLACMDISDGLAQDMAHICRASGVAAVIEADKLPVSPAARLLLSQDASLAPLVYSGGDDYELLFTAPPAQQSALAALADELHLPLTVIGHIREGSGVTLLDGKGKTLDLDKAGFTHFV